MEHSSYLSSTYLKVILRGNQEMMDELSRAPKFDIKKSLAQDYIYGDVITDIFDYLEQMGAESGLLSYGKMINAAMHGPLGYAILSAPDLHTSLTVLADYSVVRTSLLSVEFSYSGNRAEIRFNVHADHALTRRSILENIIHMTLDLIVNIITHPAGDHAQISFTGPPPRYAKELEAFYGVKCHFNADFTSLSIPASWCRITSPLYDEHSFRSNLAKCRELKLKVAGSDNLANSVKLHLQNYFEQRQAELATAKELPTLDCLAKQHFMSPRTFNRNLSKQGTNYRAILEEIRRNCALTLLSNTHLTASKISYYLAYQEPANFNRAFKRWFATTPAAWRANQSKLN